MYRNLHLRNPPPDTHSRVTIKYVRLNITLPEKLYREFKILKEGKRGVSALTREAMEKWCARARARLKPAEVEQLELELAKKVRKRARKTAKKTKKKP